MRCIGGLQFRPTDEEKYGIFIKTSMQIRYVLYPTIPLSVTFNGGQYRTQCSHIMMYTTDVHYLYTKVLVLKYCTERSENMNFVYFLCDS